MRERLSVILRPSAAGALVGSALALLGTWMLAAYATHTSAVGQTLALMLFLIVAVLVTDRYPIHIQRHTKISLISVPLYLMATLLPVYLAALAAGIAIATAELLARKERDSLPSDIVIATSRWIVMALLGSWVAHLPAANSAAHTLILIGAAFVLSLGDLATGSWHAAWMGGTPPIRMLLATAREIYPAEGAQYILGILGALAAEVYPWAIVFLIVPCVIVYLAFKTLKELGNSTRQLLESMADAVDLRDPYTGGHSRRVADYCAGILRELPLSGPEVDLIMSAARVHDIGKIGIPDHILNKPDRLTDGERAVMETHADRGADLLARYSDFARGAAIVRHHHESWDGSGYPSKLVGYAIPFGARVIAVADSFDAMTSDRPYQRGMPPAKAAQILREGRGKQWDSAIVEAFLRSIADQLEPLPGLGAVVPLPNLPAKQLVSTALASARAPGGITRARTRG
jgi:HD-GYP domain-containing protein (c-di-GMP phosphodiesterase class II)